MQVPAQPITIRIMGNGALQWGVERHAGGIAVVPQGRVDETTATEFSERLIGEVEAASAGGAARIAIQLGAVEYMSSRGLRALTLAQRRAKERQAEIVLAGPNEVMREILAISRYDLVFKVFDRVEDALAAGRTGS